MRGELIIAAIGGLVLASGAAGATKDTKLSLVAYSTPGAAFAKIIPAFQKTTAGKDISFDQSYGASEVQAKAVIAGLPADVVDLSLEPDMQRLVSAGFVAKNWKKNAYTGFVTKSVVVFVVRNGNPKKIKTWDDLVKTGVQVVTPNLSTPAARAGNAAERPFTPAQRQEQEDAEEGDRRIFDVSSSGTWSRRTRALATRCRRSSRAAATS